jgi:hypothetical protein
VIAPQKRVLYLAAIIGLVVFVAGVALGILGHGTGTAVASVVLAALGSAILFPILVSFAYDRLRERWLGDEVWRIFSELADAGIVRVYKDREFVEGRDNAQTRLAEEFQAMESGTIYMMGPTLRVFFNPLGPFYHDIEKLMRSANGKVTINALIQRNDSAAIAERIRIEEPDLADPRKAQGLRDADSTVGTIRSMVNQLGPQVSLRRFMTAPYCTAVIFPKIAFFSPNILAPVVPARLPMILFRSGSHGYEMLKASFDYLWTHPDTLAVVPEMTRQG